MRYVRDVLVCVLLAVLIALAVYGILFMRAAAETVTAMPAQIAETRAALIGEVKATRMALVGDGSATVPLPLAVQALQLIDARAADISDRTDQQVTALRSDVMAEVREIHKDSNQRLGDTLARVDAALKTVDGMRADLKPMLNNSAALAADLKDSLDDNYDDIKATIGSSTVAVTGMARAAEAVGKAAPSITQSVDSVAKSTAREADELTKPKTFWQGLKSWFLLVSRGASFFLL